MTAETPKQKRSWGLRIVGVVALCAAVAIAVTGILSRQDSDAKLAHWTDAQAVPSVNVIQAKRGEPDQEIVLPGDIQAWNQAVIYARVNGYLKNWNKDIGARVKAGDVLGAIEAPELDQQLDQARARLASAQADTNLANLTAKRWKALLSSNSVSQQTTDEKAGDAEAKAALVNAANADVKRLEAEESFKRLVAPFDGVVTARNTDIGDLITVGSGGRSLFTVSDIHTMRIYVRVPQAYAAELHAGMEADLKLTQYPTQTFQAKLLTTSNAISEESRTVLVQLTADNPDGKLWPGSYVQVHFKLPTDPNVLTLPTSALLFREHGMEVATVGPDDHVVLKPIKIGRDLGTEVEVDSGVSPSDRIIDSPSDSLEGGTEVKVANPDAAPNAGAQVAASAGPSASGTPR
jgi:RND family efflux transporter MFP subunit